MSGKTCGTCGNRCSDGYCECTTHAVSPDQECECPPEFGGYAPVESVEQVVCEMLCCIARLTEADGGCRGCADSGTPECERAWSPEPCYAMFADRLRALGVIVDG